MISYTSMRQRILASLIIAGQLAAQSVVVPPYRQKLATFYAPGDARVPSALSRASRTATASDGASWTASTPGLLRSDPRATPRDRTQYFAGRRYLPDDEVLALAPDNEAGMWVRTRTGVVHIELRRMTLEAKAALFETRIRERHDRYGLVASSTLAKPGDLSSNQLSSDDNDGLWTAMYASAECFRYAATHDPEALARAVRSTNAVLFLEHVTGRAGFPARSYIRKGDPRPLDGIWRTTGDGKYEWKADTSSDEIVGHFLLFSVAYDLLPRPELRARIQTTAQRIMDHILIHGYTLTDVDGKPTTWGRWDRPYFESPGGKPDSPLNALELLSFLKTAAHVTGNAKYEREYRKVALDLLYARQAERLLELSDEINYSDEELAMLSFYPLLRYEKDERLLSFYRSALDQWWKNIQRERNPLWIFIHALGRAATTAQFQDAIWTLNRIPMDLVEWTVINSKRPDVPLDGGPDRFKEPQSALLLPPDERPVSKWNGNPFRIDGGNGGAGEDDGAFFLLPYWMGRYHGFLN